MALTTGSTTCLASTRRREESLAARDHRVSSARSCTTSSSRRSSALAGTARSASRWWAPGRGRSWTPCARVVSRPPAGTPRGVVGADSVGFVVRAGGDPNRRNTSPMGCRRPNSTAASTRATGPVPAAIPAAIEIALPGSDPSQTDAAVRRGRIIGESANFARGVGQRARQRPDAERVRQPRGSRGRRRRVWASRSSTRDRFASWAWGCSCPWGRAVPNRRA